MANPTSSRTARRNGRSLLRPPALPLRLESLEARDVPSTSIPLTSEGWRDIGPSPIVPEATSFPQTVVPGDLSTAGRVVNTAVDPLNRNILYAATSDGGVARSVDGGATWGTEEVIASDAPPVPGPNVSPDQKIHRFLMDNLPTTTPVFTNGVSRSAAEGGPTLLATDRNLHLGYITAIRDRLRANDPSQAPILIAGGGNSNYTKFAYAGSGMWISNDGGNTWRLEKGPLTPFGNRAFEGASFQKIFYVPNPDGVREHIFAVVDAGRTYGTNFVNGVYRSDDLGVTWTDITVNIVNSGALSEPITRFDDISDFSVDPSNPNIGYVSLGDPFRFNVPGGFRGETNNGVYRTQNALSINPTVETNWTVVLGNSGGSVQIPGATLGYIRASPVPHRPSTVYALAAIAGGGLLGLYRSTDSGINFSEITGIPSGFSPNGVAMDLLIDPTTGPNYTRMFVSGANGIAVIEVNELSPSPVAIGANISVDDTGEGPHPVINRITFDRPLRAPAFPNDPLSIFGDTKLIVSGHAGVFRLETQVPTPLVSNTVSGLDWTSINGSTARGLNSTLLLEGGQPVEDTNRYIGGTWLTGSPRFNDTGGLDTPAPENALYNWPDTQGVNGPLPTGGEVIWDYRNREPQTGTLNVVYQAHSQGSGNTTILKSFDGGVTWQVSANNATPNGMVNPDQVFYGGDEANPTPAFELDPSAPLSGTGNENIRLLYGTDVVNETVDSGATWRQFGVNLPFVTGTADQFQASIAALGISRADRNVVYAYNRNRVNSANNASRGPALYRLNQNLGDNTDNVPRWRDVSPWVNPLNGALQFPDSFPGPLFGRIGFRMPDLTGAPTEPYGNVLGFGNQYSPNSIFGLPFDITDIAVDPIDPNIMYVTFDNNGLTTDDNPFTPLVNEATPDPNTRDDFTGAYQPYPGPAGQVFGRVLRTTDGGLHWQDISFQRGLPDYRVYSIVTDQNRLNGQTEDDIYIATEVGVWKLTDPANPASQWIRVGSEAGDPTGAGDRDGMPDVMVRDLDLNGSTGLMTASTFGRGAWQFPIRPFLSGFVFTDTNGNGVRDTGERGLGGVGVTAVIVPDEIEFASRVSLIDTANANTNDGFYQFTSLPNDSYDIRILNGSPGVYDPTKAFQVTTGVQNFNVTNSPRPTTTNGVLVGVVPRATVSGVKYNDINGNGVRDSGEPGLAGWTIELRRGDNDLLLDTRVTDASGAYSFTGVGVIPGFGFRINEIVQAGWTPTGQGDANGGDASTNFITNGTGAAITINFGNFRFININGFKFHDLNGNGAPELGEPRLAGWVIAATNLTTGVTVQTTTDASGNYTFTGLGNGTYRVREVLQPGWGQSSFNPGDFVAVSGGADPFIVFGNFMNATVGGILFEDENGNGTQDSGENSGLPDIVVGLFDANNPTVAVQTVLTNSSGGYTFTNVQAMGPNTRYLVRVIDGAVSQTEPDESVTLTTSGAALTVPNLAGFRRTTVSGFAFEDVNGNGTRDSGEPPLAGGPVNLINVNSGAVVATATTNASGLYTFFGIPTTNGVPLPPFRVTAGLGFIQTTPPAANVILTSGDPGTSGDIGVFRAAIVSGQKFNDLNGNGVFEVGEPTLSGWTIEMVNNATGAVQTTTTGDQGGYAFSAGPGTYTLREVQKPGFVQTSPTPAAFTTTSGATIGGRNFGNFQIFTIAGVVYHDFNGNGTRDGNEGTQSGWTVQLFNDVTGTLISTAVSDAAGAFTFGSLGAGRYRVVETVMPGWFASTPNPVILPGTSGQTQSVSFGNFFGATVTGSVFEDLNRNTVRETTEPASTGWMVQIVNTAGTVVATVGTDAAGVFTAGGLPPGTYTARLVPRVQFTQTTANPLASSPTSGGTVTLSPPVGVLQLGSISGQVFLDSNRNGTRQSFERALPTLPVSLFRDGVLVTTQTPGPDGRYAFLGLEAGNYSVRLASLPAGFATTSPASGAYNIPITVGSGSATPSVVDRDFGLIGRRRYAVAADGGGGPRVQVYDAVSGEKLRDDFAYELAFTGGVRVATGDVTGDGVDDLATVAGKGGGPRVRVLDGLTGREVYNFFAYEPEFRDGLYVALGDVNGDGFADMITGTDSGGGPRVTVYSGRDGSQLADFFAYDPMFRGGVRIGAGDTNGDGRAEVITAPGVGLETKVIVWSGIPLTPIGSFVAFEGGYAGGAFVSGGGLRPDGRTDVVVGSGISTVPAYPGSRVRVFDPNTFQLIRDVEPYPTFPGDTPVTTEVRVTAIDRNGDNIADVGVSLGAGAQPLVKFLDGRNGRQLGEPILAFEATFLGGVFIG